MARRFPIADLRTLVARALQTGTYTPADSGRIRAVPDTRTIRYYTTLGLIDGPAEMRGRTALYGEKHVMQLVAIKRLQANHQTLSDIQATLVGITPRKLKSLADLPVEFWESSDQYLADRQESNPQEAQCKEVSGADDFWSAPAALPGSISGTSSDVARCLRVALHPAVQLIFEAGDAPVDLPRLHAAAAPLMKELIRQGLLPHRNDSSTTPEASP